jgi:hypothetical protein
MGWFEYLSVEWFLRLELATLGACPDARLSERPNPRASEAIAWPEAVRAARTRKTMLILPIVEAPEKSMRSL